MLLATPQLKQNASTLPNAFEKFYKRVICSLKSLKNQMLSLQLDFRGKGKS